ncbi:MAG TPA: nitroreductase/quinone reductase family protein [Candidatus Limnocylindria bacterium]|nr:nitroreductase/quinone reductase family protein [Candidatus Limnocylindria bacterium]
MPAGRRGPLLTLLWRYHRFWYGLTGGRIGARLAGWDVLLLTTRGRKSGEPRSVTLNYLREGSAFLVIASNAGDARDPLWWRNLKANPDAEVLTGTKRVRVRPREADGVERELLWDKVVARDASYAEYERRTKRRIPVVLLEPTIG